MTRDRPIVYLATEGSLKCVLGLKEILEDGWNVRLVIGYDSAAEEVEAVVPKVSGLRAFVKKCLLLTIGRSRAARLEMPPAGTLKAICEKFGVRYQATVDKTLHKHYAQIAEVDPDVILSNGWQYHIPMAVISLARLIALNCHSSFLPEYRGGNVTYAPLINEERQSGVTVHELVEKFDAGRILAQVRVDIDANETPKTLKRKRAKITGEVLIRSLEIAGNPDLYKPNPISPFYFRCTRATYNRYKRINFWRKLFGLPIKRYEPRERYDI